MWYISYDWFQQLFDDCFKYKRLYLEEKYEHEKLKVKLKKLLD